MNEQSDPPAASDTSPLGQNDISDHNKDSYKKTKVPWWHLHRRLYDWVLHWSDTPYGQWALFILSFAESSCFPIPPDVLLAPLSLGNPRKWWRFALSCSIASVIGGLAGFGIGYFLWWGAEPGTFSGVAEFFFAHIPGFTPDVFETMREKYETWSFWIVFTAGFTPIPYKVITISSGAFDIPLGIFILASAISRSARFFLVAGLFRLFGPKIKPFIDRYFNLLCILFTILLIGGFLVIKTVH